MAWERMKSESEKRRQANEAIRGFMPFTLDATVEGTIEKAVIKDDGRGFFILRATAPCTVNVQDKDSKTGQGKAQIGELVGVRKTGATKLLSELQIGTLVSLVYLGMTEHKGLNPKTNLMESNQRHNIAIDVYRPEIA
jgi:hypothetical protein